MCATGEVCQFDTTLIYSVTDVERHWARRISFVANKFSKEVVELQT
jgi:hypothetical protein